MSIKQIYAVSIGISRYRKLRPLACAAHDAHDLVEVLQSGASPAQIRLLLNEEATKQNILGELKWLAQNAPANSTAVVFFSGHGGRPDNATRAQACFCPFDASLRGMERTCITSAELTAALRTIRSERLVVLLDTCYSGGLGEPRKHGGVVHTGLTSRDVDALIEGQGRVIMAASRPDESAWELSGMRNGLFTNYLLRGLRGESARPDGTVWASEVFGYISRQVRHHGCQHPYQKAIGEDFVVIVQPQAASQPQSLALTQLDQRSLRQVMRKAYNRAELSLLCRDLGLSLEDLPGTTLETQLMELIDHCQRHGLYDQLLEQMQMDRRQLILSS